MTNLKRGDILLYHGEGFIAHMIRFVTNSEWSHAAWVVNEKQLLESDWAIFGPKGVQFKDISAYPAESRKIIRTNVPFEKVNQALDMALTKLGERYDLSLFFSIFRSWLREIFLFWRRKKRKYRNQRHGWICSELVATPMWKRAGFKFADDVPVEAVTPADIWESVSLGRAEVVEEPASDKEETS